MILKVIAKDYGIRKIQLLTVLQETLNNYYGQPISVFVKRNQGVSS